MIIFKTKHHADVVMFDQVALNLIGLMGHSKNVPGALVEEELNTALENLNNALTKSRTANRDSWDDDNVSIANRAKPLLDLLATAINNQEHVIWEKSLR